MYTDAMSFLEDEREAWRPYEALADLSDEQLSVVVEGAHGWRGRDLMGHLVAWQEAALAMARDLAVGETSASKERADADWEARGDAVNDDLLAAWAGLPMVELRRRFGSVAGELRGYLTVVPESRWIKHATHMDDFISETLEHYEEHLPDLQAILESAR